MTVARWIKWGGWFCLAVVAGCSRSERPAAKSPDTATVHVVSAPRVEAVKSAAVVTQTVVASQPEGTVAVPPPERAVTNRPVQRPNPVTMHAAQVRREEAAPRILNEHIVKLSGELDAVMDQVRVMEERLRENDPGVKQAFERLTQAEQAYQGKRAAVAGLADLERKRDELKKSFASLTGEAGGGDGRRKALTDEIVGLTRQIHEVETAAQQTDEGVRQAGMDKEAAQAAYAAALMGVSDLRGLMDRKRNLQGELTLLSQRMATMTQEKK